jgi:hypothetical protein
MNDGPKMGTVEYVSSSGHQVDAAGNCFLSNGGFLTKLTKISMSHVKAGNFAGMRWTPVNVIVANE